MTERYTHKPGIAPLTNGEILDYYSATLQSLIADLWTLRDAINAGPIGGRTLATSRIPDVAEHLGSAHDLIARIAHDLDLRLASLE